MKEFNLEEYLANPSQKLITRDGRKVRILCTEARGSYPIVALVERKNSEVDDTFSYTKDGRFLTIKTDERDIFFALEKHEGWINLYNVEGIYVPSQIYETKKSAEASSCRNCIATIKIEWEE